MADAWLSAKGMTAEDLAAAEAAAATAAAEAAAAIDGPVQAEPVTSPRALRTAFADLRDDLDGTDAEWDDRVDRLRRLQALILGGATEVSNWTSQFETLRTGVADQLADLRSKVPKEACDVVIAIAATAGPRAAPLGDFFVPHLVDKLRVKKAAVWRPADAAVKALLTHRALSGSGLADLASRLTDKNKAVRKFCAGYVEQVLGEWDVSSLAASKEALVDALQRGSGDADPGARTASRNAVVAFAKLYPDDVAGLVAGCDLTVQKALNKLLAGAAGGASAAGSAGKKGRKRKTGGGSRKSDAGDAEKPWVKQRREMMRKRKAMMRAAKANSGANGGSDEAFVVEILGGPPPAAVERSDATEEDPVMTDTVHDAPADNGNSDESVASAASEEDGLVIPSVVAAEPAPTVIRRIGGRPKRQVVDRSGPRRRATAAAPATGDSSASGGGAIGKARLGGAVRVKRKNATPVVDGKENTVEVKPQGAGAKATSKATAMLHKALMAAHPATPAAAPAPPAAGTPKTPAIKDDLPMHQRIVNLLANFETDEPVRRRLKMMAQEMGEAATAGAAGSKRTASVAADGGGDGDLVAAIADAGAGETREPSPKIRKGLGGIKFVC